MKTLADRIEENLSQIVSDVGLAKRGDLDVLAAIREWQHDDAGRSEFVETLLGEVAEMLEGPRVSVLEVYALIVIARDHDQRDPVLASIYTKVKTLADAASRVAWLVVERDIAEGEVRS